MSNGYGALSSPENLLSRYVRSNLRFSPVGVDSDLFYCFAYNIVRPYLLVTTSTLLSNRNCSYCIRFVFQSSSVLYSSELNHVNHQLHLSDFSYFCFDFYIPARWNFPSMRTCKCYHQGVLVLFKTNDNLVHSSFIRDYFV